MDFFLAEGGSCSYDDETISNIEVPSEVQTSSKTMGTQGSSSTKHIFLCEREDISNCAMVITWFGVVLHG